jgi:ABC-type transport system involved in multi-copper enzyme maturation permease subunit
MILFPIVERELRVASRQERTWLYRVVMGLLALGYGYYIYDRHGHWFAKYPFELGYRCFEGLSHLLFGACIAAGAFATSDCISRERQENTLGLLFLTDLHPFNLVLGKLTAASLVMFYAFLAVLPILALTLLFGGITLGQLCTTCLALMVIMFFSLALGVFVSATTSHPRASFLILSSILAFMAIGMPILTYRQFSLSWPEGDHLILDVVVPFNLLRSAMDSRGVHNPILWWNLVCLHGVSWLFLWGAMICMRRSVHKGASGEEQVALPKSMKNRENPRSGHAEILTSNPLMWIVARQPLKRQLTWLVAAATIIFWLAQFWQWGVRILDPSITAGFVWLSQWVFYSWIGFEIVHRVLEERQSGTLELLLTTPLPERDILRSYWQAICCQFRGALIVTWVFHAALIAGHFCRFSSWYMLRYDSTILNNMVWLMVFPLALITIVYTGVAQGMCRKKPLIALAGTLWTTLVRPLVVWWVINFGWEIYYHSLTWQRQQTLFIDQWIFSVILLLLLTINLLFCWRQADRKLRHRFRELAQGG